MKNDKNYWIVALAVAMFFATMVSSQMSGIQNGFYYFVWMMVGYYGFKGNYDSLKQWMAIIIGLNVFGLCVLFFVDEMDLLFISSGGKWDLVAGVVIMLVPKIVLYLYSKNKIESYKNQQMIYDKINQNPFKSNVMDVFHGFVKGFKEGMAESEVDSKSVSPARFVNLRGVMDKRIPRTLSDYLWQSIFSLIIALIFGFVAYEAGVKIYANENSILIIAGALFGLICAFIFIVLTLIYLFRFVHVLSERGIVLKDFFLEFKLVAIFGFIALVVFWE